MCSPRALANNFTYEILNSCLTGFVYGRKPCSVGCAAGVSLPFIQSYYNQPCGLTQRSTVTRFAAGRRTNEWFIELGRLPMSNRWVGDGVGGGRHLICINNHNIRTFQQRFSPYTHTQPHPHTHTHVPTHALTQVRPRSHTHAHPHTRGRAHK